MKKIVFLMALISVLTVAGPLLYGQEATEGAVNATGVEQDTEEEEDKVDLEQIDQILQGDQDAKQGEFFSYDPEGRRDPFRSLLEGRNNQDELVGQVRPPGLPGMMVEELTLEGIIDTPAGIMAFVLGRDNVSYIIRPETKLYNGEVKEILQDRVIFRQQVNDPKQTRPFEEVVRVLSE